MTNHKIFFTYEIISLKDDGDAYVPCSEKEVEAWGLFGVLYEGKKHAALKRIYTSENLKDCTELHYQITGHTDYYYSVLEDDDA